jgi:hypothetical protein
MKMVPLLRRRRGWGGGATINHPSLSKVGNYAAIFRPGGEPKDHETYAQDDMSF